MDKTQLCIHFIWELLDLYEFELYTDKDENGELVFMLTDLQGANLGDINSDTFYNLGQVISRLDIYHNDYIYEDLLELGIEWDTREELIKIEDNDYDYDLTVAKFLGSDNIANILMDITPKYYEEYHSKIKDNRVKAREPYNYLDIKKYL